MIYTRQQRWQFLEEELKAQTEAFQHTLIIADEKNLEHDVLDDEVRTFLELLHEIT